MSRPRSKRIRPESGTRYEKNVLKLDGRPGRADVWRKGCFAWEYKGHKKNLTAAYSQLKEYADALENPPLLIVSDMREIRIHTNFTNTIAETSVFQLADLNAFEVRQKLRWAFTDPERLRPELTREKVTAAAAATFGRIAQKLIGQGYDRKRVAHFLNKLVFCLFAEDIELLPERVFADILDESVKQPDLFAPMLADLFRAMRERERPLRDDSEFRGSTAACSMTTTCCLCTCSRSRTLRKRLGSTGARSSPRSSARCSSAASTPRSASRWRACSTRRSADARPADRTRAHRTGASASTTPTPRRS